MKLALESLDTVTQITERHALGLVFHSLALGIFLMAITALISHLTATRQDKPKAPVPGAALPVPPPSPGDIVLNAANVLYLCLGMTGVMILVSNNLARAFAIGAAIALVRFRVKVDSKSFAMCLFFGVLVGMACGVDQLHIAYGMTGIFSSLQIFVYFLSRAADRLSSEPEVAPVPDALELEEARV